MNSKRKVKFIYCPHCMRYSWVAVYDDLEFQLECLECGRWFNEAGEEKTYGGGVRHRGLPEVSRGNP